MDYNNYSANSCQPLQAPCSAMAVQVVPVYSPPGYESLTHGPCAFDHLNISQAYPSNCDKFTQRLCDCNCSGGVRPGPIVMPKPSLPPPPISPSAIAQNMFESYKRPYYRRN